MTPETTAQILFAVQCLAGMGAGTLASELFSWLQGLFPLPATRPAAAWAIWGYRLLHSPRYKRMVPPVLSVVIGAGLAALPATLTGADPIGAAIGAVVAMLTAQIKHALGKSGEVLA